MTSSLLREVFLEGGVGRKILWHAHLDIQGRNPFEPEERQRLETFQGSIKQEAGFTFDDQLFNRLKVEELERIIPATGRDLIELLARQDLYGAPLAHWTIMSTHSESSPRAKAFQEAYLQMTEVAAGLNRPSYVEIERVRQQTLKSNKGEASGEYQTFPATPFELVPVESLGRTFRDSEIHLSFADMSLVQPQVFQDLFGHLGFRIAYRYYAETCETSIIATIQGFEPDMSVLYAKAIDWVEVNQASGHIGCDVRLKWEEIVWHKLMNDPEVMPAVVPGSVTC